MGDNVVSLIDLLSSVGLTVIISVFLFSVIKNLKILLTTYIIFIILFIIDVNSISYDFFSVDIYVGVTVSMIFALFYLMEGKRHIAPNCRIAENSRWQEMMYRYPFLHRDTIYFLERLFYRLFPTYNDIAACWHQYLLIKKEYPSFKEIFNAIQSDIFIRLHDKKGLSIELHERKSTYQDVIYIIMSHLAADMVEDRNLYAMDNPIQNLFTTNPTSFFIFCIQKLRNSGLYSPEEYAEAYTNVIGHEP